MHAAARFCLHCSAPRSEERLEVASTGQSAPPAGWYPDPQGGAARRYWDGAHWTEHLSGPEGSPAGATRTRARTGPARTQGARAAAVAACWAACLLSCFVLSASVVTVGFDGKVSERGGISLHALSRAAPSVETMARVDPRGSELLARLTGPYSWILVLSIIGIAGAGALAFLPARPLPLVLASAVQLVVAGLAAWRLWLFHDAVSAISDNMHRTTAALNATATGHRFTLDCTLGVGAWLQAVLLLAIGFLAGTVLLASGRAWTAAHARG